ncbi:MAG: xanthine dehydrogenase family protein [Chloroflexi bacterium]|nr:xanthine dehydrogenase family protein [Chloroflexota bacterium]
MAIGQRVPMVDAVERVTGRVQYTLNLELPGMLVGRILRSTQPHARLARVDARAAERLPGVLAVVTRDDLRDRERFDPFFGPLVRDQPVLALDQVRYVGEAVAAVAAVDEATAEQALELIEVEYEPLPAVFDPEAALAPEAPVLHGESNVMDRYQVRRGDVEQGFREADLVFEAEYRTPPVQHVPLEPHVSIGQVVGDRITLWSATQTPHNVRAQVAAIFRRPLSQVRIIVPTLGGGYGSKCYPKLEPLAALLAWKARRPVKLALSRAEDLLTTNRSGSIIRLKTGILRDGTLVAHRATCYFSKGAYTETGPRVVASGTRAGAACYRTPNVQLDGYTVFTNLPPSGPFRAPGAAQTVWAMESHLDAIARQLGLDPLALRRKNLVRDGDRYVGGGVLEALHFDPLLERATRAIDWDAPRPESAQPSVRRGKGVAISLKTLLTPSISTAACKLNEDGSLSVLTSSVEMGQGAKTVLAQIAAEAMGLPLDQVLISEPDTDTTPYDQTTSSTRTTSCMGAAIRLAVGEVQRQVAELAAAELEVAPEDVVLADGRASVRGVPERSTGYGELVRKSRRGNLLGHGTFVNRAKPDPVTGEPGASSEWHHAVSAAEVEVDTDTGKVRVLRFHSGVFVGRMVNPTQCELQTEGSVTFGLGQGLQEELVFDDGRLANPNLGDYLLPSFKDLPPELSVQVLEDAGLNEIHGIGETSLPSVVAAVGNAVADALGVTVRELPLTPERVLRAIQEAGQDDPAR